MHWVAAAQVVGRTWMEMMEVRRYPLFLKFQSNPSPLDSLAQYILRTSGLRQWDQVGRCLPGERPQDATLRTARLLRGATRRSFRGWARMLGAFAALLVAALLSAQFTYGSIAQLGVIP